MSFEITGKLIEKFDTVEISSKFKKREFVIETKDNSNGFEFTENIKFQLTQDKCSLIENIRQDSNIKVSFNIRGRKWEKEGNVSYFTNLEAWRIEDLSEIQQTDSNSAMPADEAPLPSEEDFSGSSSQEFDDLPF
jgi:single-strand DNA-binding protein